uniref:ABC transporter A family member 2 n=1 Tax=Solanum tuberosum TaxID=4113 RepID=M1D6K5_SOLTU
MAGSAGVGYPRVTIQPAIQCSITIDGSSQRSSCGLFWLSTLTISYRTQQV